MPLTVDFIETKSENLIFDAEVIKCKVNVRISLFFIVSLKRTSARQGFSNLKVLLGFSCFYVSSLW